MIVLEKTVNSILFFFLPFLQLLLVYMRARLCFSCLSLVWFYSTLKAYRAVRCNDVTSHRNWMTRSYTITFAAVMLRIWFPLFQFAFHFPENDAYSSQLVLLSAKPVSC
jgi:Predicted membrane protein (DUF2306)